jgi:hypothetical protein
MATLDRIDTAYTPWTPSAAGLATEDEDYIGRHRKPGPRGQSVLRMFSTSLFHTGRHRSH